MGDLTTIVVPMFGHAPIIDRSAARSDCIVVAPMQLSRADHPWSATRAPQYLGARLASELDPFDLVVVFTSYLAPFGVGLVSADHTPLVVDLDVDDAELADSSGDHDAARRFRTMIQQISPRVALMVSAQGFGGTLAVPNVFPLGTPMPEDSPVLPEAASPADDLAIMVGDLTDGPDLDGARWLARDVWPLVQADHPSGRLVIAGQGSEGVEHGVGFVADLTELYRTATLTVAPIHHGSGTGITILESWIQRVPVVSTLRGVDGLQAVHGEHVLIASDAWTMAEQISRLLEDPDLRRRLAGAGARHARERFDPDVIGARARRALERVMTPPVGPRRIDGPVVTEVDDGLVVDDEAHGLVHRLDTVAAIVYSLCDGEQTSHRLADTLAHLSGASTGPESVRAVRWFYIALDQLIDRGLVSEDPAFERCVMPGSERRFRVRSATFDHRVAHLVYSEGEYAVPDRLPSGTVAIDIGGHIGSFSARMVDSGAAHVIALEPQPDNHRLFQINLAAEIEAGLVDIRRRAVWSPPADQEIVLGPAPMFERSGQPPDANTGGHAPRVRGEGEQVGNDEFVATSVPLDALIEEVRGTYGTCCELWLKIDCEGGEWPALETAEQLGEVDVIIGEIHLLEGSPQRLQRLGERLTSFGFEVDIDVDLPIGTLARLRATKSRAAS